MINNILIEVYTTLAEEELKRTKIRQRQGIDSMPVNERGKKYSKKTGREVGRPNKQENLTTEQERYIKAWLSKNIKLADCIKLSGLSRATLYRIKANLTSKANNSEPKIEKIKEPFDTLYDDNIEDFIYFNDENYMKLLVFMEKNLIYKFTTATNDDKNLYLLKNKHKKIYKALETYIKQLSSKEREEIYAKIVYRLENYLVLDKKVIEKIKKALKPIFLR